LSGIHARRTVSVVVPARNAQRTLGRVLEALASQQPAPAEVIVVDNDSTDGTAEIASAHGAHLVEAPGRSAGGARNAGWDAADSDVVVFLDSDAVPEAGWSAGLFRALDEFPGAIVGCARTFRARTAWGWVAHLQCETPYLPFGSPRRCAFVSSYCMAVPRAAPLRWDESYGGEDGIFCVDAHAAGIRLVFDPRFVAEHDHDRETFAALLRQQQRLAYGLARVGAVQREGRRKRILSRVPIHYFLLARLPAIFWRVRADGELRHRFVRTLPFLVVAEWTLGANALRYALRRPPLRRSTA
jgi:glycosyltransferase involved in cell wall biosynthesis